MDEYLPLFVALASGSLEGGGAHVSRVRDQMALSALQVFRNRTFEPTTETQCAQREMEIDHAGGADAWILAQAREAHTYVEKYTMTDGRRVKVTI